MEDRAKLGSPTNNRIHWIAFGFMMSEDVCHWRRIMISRASAPNERMEMFHDS